jgi:hypothetical protein
VAVGTSKSVSDSFSFGHYYQSLLVWVFLGGVRPWHIDPTAPALTSTCLLRRSFWLLGREVEFECQASL